MTADNSTNSTSNTVDQQKRALKKIRELKAEVAALKSEQGSQNSEVAVVGMGCRFPGNVNTPDEYWDLLSSGRDGITAIPQERWDIDAYYDPDPDRPGKMYVREGGFLSQVDLFDPDFFGLSQREVNSMDPQQRLLLEVGWEAIENANIAPKNLSGSRTGVYMGVCTQDYAGYSLNSNNPQNIDVYSFTGNAPSITSGRISNILNLRGPNITVDTACSSSLVAVHLAIQSLRSGETDLALAGGVNVILRPENFIYFCKVNALSPDARCKTFDDSANGYVRAEGCGVVVLKLLTEAIANGDEIHGIIRGSAINQDGQSYGLTAPNGNAQRTLIQDALTNAKAQPGDISFVESHGTGTPLGDPIEVAALSDIYCRDRARDRPLLLGAVKSNIGHTEAAAGMAGLIKTLLCLKHNAITPNLHFQQPNQKIDWENLPIAIPCELQPWSTEQPQKMAGVSAFGFSGTNVHLILENAINSHQVFPSNRLSPSIFNRQRCWLDSVRPQLSSQTSETIGDRDHPLLGKPVLSCLTSQSQQFCYEALINLDRVGYFRSHPVWGKIVMPGSGYVEIATVAAQKIYGTIAVELQNIVYQEAFVLREDHTERLQIALNHEEDDSFSFQVFSLAQLERQHQAQWRHHASGSLKAISSATSKQQLDRESLLARCQQHLTQTAFYQRLAKNGYSYGQDHQGVEQAWLGEGEILTQIAYPESLNYSMTNTDEDYYFHPALLDSAYQPLLMLLPPVAQDQMYVTLGKESVKMYLPPENRMWVHTQQQLDNSDDNNNVKADVYIYNEQGELLAETTGYVMTRTANTRPVIGEENSEPHSKIEEAGVYYQVSWQEDEVDSKSIKQEQNLGLQLILADRQGYGVSLCEEMSAQSIDCVLLHRGEPINRLTNQNNYQLASPDAAGLKQVCQKLRQEGFDLTKLDKIIYCWGLDDRLPTGARTEITPWGCAPLAVINSWLSQQNDLSVKGLTVITRNAQQTDTYKSGLSFAEIEPLQAAYWGLAGVVQQECPELKLRCIDLDFEAYETASVPLLLQSIGGVGNERLMAIRDLKLLVPRLSKVKATQLQNSAVVPEAETRHLKLAMASRGDLSSLNWVEQSRQSLQANEVEIGVKATGLNLRDIIDGLGLHPRRLYEFGLECSGVVTAVGQGVKDICVGDEVVAFGTGCFSQYFVTTEERIAIKPQHLSFAEAASIPIAFLTAYYALESCADLKPGDKILIHAAAGGVGMAAVKLALQAGATVYGTASPQKWSLLKELGVHQVANSRDLNFAARIQGWTNGEGIDLVLNSLTGEFIDRSVGLLKSGGKFVEIGLKGWSGSQMSLKRADVEYRIVNLMAKWESDPKSVKTMLVEILAMFQQRQPLSPLPHKCFDRHLTVDAFRYMQQGKHIGKVVIAGEEQHASDGASKSLPFSGTHVITGGLGAIGLKLAQHLVTQGCTSLALLSRRSLSADLEAVLTKLRAKGAVIEVFRADVASPDLQRVLNDIRRRMAPIKGIYHSAGVTDDGLITELDEFRFEKVFQPKISGTYRLHQLTLKDDLRYFVLFSSMTSMFGSIGVANYAAANAFMNSFAYYRNSLGLPGVAIAWGPWADTGMFKTLDPAYRERLNQSGLHALNDEQNLDCFSNLLGQTGVFGVFQIQWQKWIEQHQTAWQNPLFEKLLAVSSSQGNKTEKNGANFRQIGNGRSSEQKQDSKILQKLQRLPARQRQQAMTSFLKQQLVEILALENSNLLDEETGFFDLGMDSLTSVEFRNRIQSRLACNLPITVTYDYPSVTALSVFLLEQIQLTTDQPSNAFSQERELDYTTEDSGVATDVAVMSEAEIIAELMK